MKIIGQLAEERQQEQTLKIYISFSSPYTNKIVDIDTMIVLLTNCKFKQLTAKSYHNCRVSLFQISYPFVAQMESRGMQLAF